VSAAELTKLALACNPKQRAFANLLADGVEPSEAYRQAYGDSRKDKGLSALAASAKASPTVQAYLSALVAKQEKAKALSRERKRHHLAEFVESKTERTADRIKAIEVDNVMTGDNAPQQVEVFGLSDLLALVRKRRE
jgi:hypothetical protein